MYRLEFTLLERRMMTFSSLCPDATDLWLVRRTKSVLVHNHATRAVDQLTPAPAGTVRQNRYRKLQTAKFRNFDGIGDTSPQYGYSSDV